LERSGLRPRRRWPSSSSTTSSRRSCAEVKSLRAFFPGRARLWDVADGRERSGPPTTNSLLLAFAPDRRVLASAVGKGISLWESASGKERGRVEFESPSENVDTYLPCLRFSPDGRWLAWGTIQGIDLADMQRGRRVHSFTGHENAVTGLEFAPDTNPTQGYKLLLRVRSFSYSFAQELGGFVQLDDGANHHAGHARDYRAAQRNV
jgi:WD40 repeat protein